MKSHMVFNYQLIAALWFSVSPLRVARWRVCQAAFVAPTAFVARLSCLDDPSVKSRWCKERYFASHFMVDAIWAAYGTALRGCIYTNHTADNDLNVALQAAQQQHKT